MVDARASNFDQEEDKEGEPNERDEEDGKHEGEDEEDEDGKRENGVTSENIERTNMRDFEEMLGLRHQLVGFDNRKVGKSSEITFESPNSLVGGQH